MAANGISQLTTNGVADKQKRQLAKLALAYNDRTASGKSRTNYDITQLPATWEFENNTNVLLDNPNSGGLLPGRPWVVGLSAPTILDFTTNQFRTRGQVKLLNDATTFARAGNATMVDSDGLLKWAPHNELTYSEDFSNAAWLKTHVDVTVADDGFTTVENSTANAYPGITQSTSLAGTVSFTADVRQNNTDSVVFRIIGTGIDGATHTTNRFTFATNAFVYNSGGDADSLEVQDLGGGIYRLTVKATGTTIVGAAVYPAYGDGVADEAVDTRYPRLYRSDLGGMVNNPETGDSYVPTTSAAVYLPRQNHHIYNGTAWVNAGLLVEPESATNLLTYSEDFTNASWGTSNTATLAIDAAGPDGETSAVTLVDSNAGGSTFVRIVSAGISVSTSTAYTASIYAKADQLSYLHIRLLGFTTPTDGGVWFDLATGTVGTENTGCVGGITDVGGGYFRCSVTFTTDATDTAGQVLFYVCGADNVLAVDLDGTSSILIYGAQLEASSVPTSYIPTTSATVARAAETLVIPAANLPDHMTPTYIGDELVTNGTFDTGISGWVDSSELTGSIAWNDSGYIELNGGGSSDEGAANQVLTTVSGQTYRLQASKTRSSITQVGTGPMSGDLYQSLNTGTDTDIVFVATGTSTYVTFRNFNIVGTVSVDNVSVREIVPLAVSIQMDGYMTYADTDTSVTAAIDGELVWYRRFIDVNNSIGAAMQTLGVDTGRPLFIQAETSSGVDTAAGSSTEYEAGINVPFNIASRHGSTFVNGAVGGTALTANTTPVAIADLSATDLALASTGGPMIITKFRMWAEDIGDTGIAEASA